MHVVSVFTVTFSIILLLQNSFMKIAPRLLGISMLGMVACKSSPTDKTIARELCSCLEPMIEMYHKMEESDNQRG